MRGSAAESAGAVRRLSVPQAASAAAPVTLNDRAPRTTLSELADASSARTQWLTQSSQFRRRSLLGRGDLRVNGVVVSEGDAIGQCRRRGVSPPRHRTDHSRRLAPPVVSVQFALARTCASTARAQSLANCSLRRHRRLLPRCVRRESLPRRPASHRCKSSSMVLSSHRSAIAVRFARSSVAATLLLLLHAGFAAAAASDVGGGSGGSDFAAVRSADGVAEVVLQDGDAVASELVATHDGRELRLLQVANGSRVAALILGAEGDELLDCDVSSPAKAAELKRYVAERLSGGGGFTAARLSAATRRSLTAVDKWIIACRAFHERQLRALEDGTFGDDGDDPAARRTSRGKRSMIPLVYPGTKWCGRGNRAVAYDDLGERRIADSCCRVHDHCPRVIQPMTTKFNYFNYRLYTVSHCDCDVMLHKCLKRAIRKHSDSVSQMIGHLFFNVVAMPCFVLEEQDVCAERSWWGTCVRTEKLTKARISNDTRRF